MQKITKRNYYSQNKGLSNSKIKDFRKGKDYFFKKHISGELKSRVSDPMIIGQAVDAWLTMGEKVFRSKYYFVDRRDKLKEDYELQLTKTMFDEVENICKRVEKQTAFKEIRGFKKQSILQVPCELGEHFNSLIGMPDWYKIKGDTAIIVDLKTAESAVPNKYYFKCLNYGYFGQAAMYRFLLRSLHPEVNSFKNYHIVCEKDPDGINNVYTFELAQALLDREDKNLFHTIEEIKNEKHFLAYDSSFKTAIMLGDVEENEYEA
jgi:hypothetical protein